MKFSKIVQYLQDKNCLLNDYQISQDVQIDDFNVFLGSGDTCSENILYFTSGVSPDLSKPGLLNIVADVHSQAAESFAGADEVNYILLDQKDLGRAFDWIKALFDHSHHIEQSYDAMLDKVFNGKELNEVIDVMMDNKANSVVVIDLCGKIIAHSSDFYINDPMWISSIQSGYCPADFMMHLRSISKQSDLPVTLGDKGSFSVLCQETGITYLCSRVLLGREHIAYSFMFNPENHFNSYAYFSLSMLSKIVSRYLGHNVPAGRNGTYAASLASQSLMQELIENNNSKEPIAKIQGLHYSLTGLKRVVCLSSRYFQTGKYAAETYLPFLRQLFQAELYAEYSNMCVFLCSDPFLSDFLRERVHGANRLEEGRNFGEKDQQAADVLSFSRLFKEQDLIIGISKAFEDLRDFQEYYTQAKNALGLALHHKTEDPIVIYEEVAYLDILDNLPLSIPIQRYIHPAIPKLAAYDKANRTNLLETLAVLSKSAFNIQLTADLMFIHRNTISYRKKQMEEICGIDLSDPTTCFELTCSVKMSEFFNAR